MNLPRVGGHHPTEGPNRTKTWRKGPGSLHKPLNQPHSLGADNKNNGNYELAACEKETPNTVS